MSPSKRQRVQIKAVGSVDTHLEIFPLNELSWSQADQLTPHDAATSTNFGRAVAITADWILVGAFGDDQNGNDAGAAYLYPTN